MDKEHLKHYLADSPPLVVPLKIKPHLIAWLSYLTQIYESALSLHARWISSELPESIHVLISTRRP